MDESSSKSVMNEDTRRVPRPENMIPQEDADGKHPCSHCKKTYLHVKHLKRHIVRRGSSLKSSCWRVAY